MTRRDRNWWVTRGGTAIYAVVAFLLASNAWSPGVFNSGSPNHLTMVLTLLITLPLSLITLPAMYVFAALAVNVLGTPDANGHVTWVTGIVMGLWFAGIAVANVWAMSRLRRTRRAILARRAAKAEVGEPVSPYAT